MFLLHHDVFSSALHAAGSPSLSTSAPVCHTRVLGCWGHGSARDCGLINQFPGILYIALPRRFPSAEFQQYADHAKVELQKLREQMTNSEEAQKRHADTLRSVEGLVENSNVELSDVKMTSEDIAKAMERHAASAEANQRGTMAIQYFLATLAAGGVDDKEQAMKMLESSFKEMGATLPSQLLQGAVYFL